MAGFHRRGLATALAALVCCAAAVVAGVPSAALAVAGRAVSGRTVSGVELANHPAAPPGTNLLVNPGAQAGAASARGWDSVTIPGWQVSSGLPTVVRYGTTHFPAATGRWPARHDGQMFAGGAGGTARLRQVIPLRSAAGAPVPAGTHYRLSAWLGGTARSRAAVTVAFLSAAGRVLGAACHRPGRPGFRPGRAGAPGRHRHAAARGSQRPGHAGPGDIADRHRRPGLAVRGLRPGGCR